MAPTAGGSSTPKSSRRKGKKKSGVPTRDKLSKAIAMVQSSKQKVAPPKLDLTHLTEEHVHQRPAPPSGYDAPASNEPEAGTSNTFGNDFADNLYRAINQENEPSPKTRRVLTPRSAVAAAKKAKEQHHKLAENRKTKSESQKSSAPTNTGSVLTPRAAAAAAMAAEKRRSRLRREQLEKTNTRITVASPNTSAEVDFNEAATRSGAGTATGGRRVNPTGRYHRDLNYKSHQEDIEAAMKFSNAIEKDISEDIEAAMKFSSDIEKDIQATSQTLAQIDEFIDTVSHQPKKESSLGSRSNNNNSFVQIYKRNMNDQYSVALGDDDPTIDSRAARAEIDEGRDPESTREPEEDSRRESSRTSSGGWDLEQFAGARIQNTGRIHLEDHAEFDSVATYASKKTASSLITAPTVSLDPVTVGYIATTKTHMKVEDHELTNKESAKAKKGKPKNETPSKSKQDPPKPKKETPKAKKDEISKMSGFDALLSVAAASLSENYMNKHQQLDTTLQVNTHQSPSAQLDPIQISSGKSSTQTIPIQVDSNSKKSSKQQIPIHVVESASEESSKQLIPIPADSLPGPSSKQQTRSRTENPSSDKSDSAAPQHSPNVLGGHRDAQPEASPRTRSSAESDDPPDNVHLQPHIMGSQDELQPQQDRSRFSFDSLDTSKKVLDIKDSLETPANPDLLLQISAFIDKVEQKNGKKKPNKHKSSVLDFDVKDPMMEAMDNSTFATDFNSEMLDRLFDEPITRRTRRSQEVRSQEVDKKKKDEGHVPKSTHLESNEVNPFKWVDSTDTATLGSTLPDNNSTWMEMEQLLNSIKEQNDHYSRARDTSSDKDVQQQQSSELYNKTTQLEEKVANETSVSNNEATPSNDDSKVESNKGSRGNDGSEAGSAIDPQQPVSTKEEDPICLVRGDLVAESPKRKEQSLTASRNEVNPTLIDTKPKRRPQLEPATETTALTEDAFGLTILASSQPQRGADPPTNVDGGLSRPKEDPPAEIVSPPATDTSQTNATPRNWKTEQAESIFVSSLAEEVPRMSASPRNRTTTKKQMEPSPRNSNDVRFVDDEKSNSPKCVTKQIKVFRFDVEETGTEAIPINVECATPTPKGGDKSEPIFVDLTEVCSGDICKNEAEKDRPTLHIFPEPLGVEIKAPEASSTSPESESLAQDKALKELLALAETPKGTGPSFERVLSADSEDVVSVSDNFGFNYETIAGADAGKQGTPSNQHFDHSKTTYDSSNKAGSASESLLANNGVAISSANDDKTSTASGEDPIGFASEGSTKRQQPTENYSGDGPEEIHVDEASEDQAETDQDDFLNIVGSKLSQIASEDDDGPIQSLLFAQTNDAPELTAERKEAGLSLVQLTLDEVKNFVDDSNIFDQDAVSKQRISQLEQLDRRVPSLLTDLKLGSLSYEAKHERNHQDDTLLNPSTIERQVKEATETESSLDHDPGITVTYDFQPASEQSSKDRATEDGKRRRKTLSTKKSGKKGLKRKFSYDSGEPSPNVAVPDPSNWLSSLDHLFSCKQTTPKGKKNKGKTSLLAETRKASKAFPAEACTGEEHQSDLHSDLSGSVYPSSFDPSMETKQVSTREKPEEGSELDHDNIAMPSTPSDEVGEIYHALFESEGSLKNEEEPSANSKPQLTETTNTEEETSEVYAGSEEEGAAAEAEETQDNATSANIKANDDPNGPHVAETHSESPQQTENKPNPKLFSSDVVDGEKSEFIDDGDLGVSAEASQQPPSSREVVQVPSPKGPNNERASTFVFDVSSSTDDSLPSDVDSSNSQKSSSALEKATRDSSVSDVDATLQRAAAALEKSNTKASKAPDLLKFASQSDSLQVSEGSIAGEAAEVQKEPKATQERSPKFDLSIGDESLVATKAAASQNNTGNSPKEQDQQYDNNHHKVPEKESDPYVNKSLPRGRKAAIEAASPKSLDREVVDEQSDPYLKPLPTGRKAAIEAASPKSLDREVVDEQSDLYGKKPPPKGRKAAIDAASPKSRESEVVDEAQAQTELMRQASSMLGPAPSEQWQTPGEFRVQTQASEPLGLQSPMSPSDSHQQQKNARAGQKAAELFMFPSQLGSDSLSDGVDEILGVPPKSWSSTPHLPPKPPTKKVEPSVESRVGLQAAAVSSPRSNKDPAAGNPLKPSLGAARGTSPKVNNVPAAVFDAYIDEESLPDRYQVEIQNTTSDDEFIEELGSLSVSPQPGLKSKSSTASPRSKLEQHREAQESPLKNTKESNGWENFVDLTDFEGEDGRPEEKEVEDEESRKKEKSKGKIEDENAWQTSLNLGSLQDGSCSDNPSWDKPQAAAPKIETHKEQAALKTNAVQETGKDLSPRDDKTPKMHENKHFDFIEDVDEDDNIDAYFSRMTSLKKGGHLPNLNIKALGSYADGPDDENGEDGIEVDLDVGFVKKSFAPMFQDLSDDEEDEGQAGEEDEGQAGRHNRYLSLDESADEDDQPRRYRRSRLETISDNEDEMSSFVASSQSYADRVLSDGVESLGSSANNPIVLNSTVSATERAVSPVRIPRGQVGPDTDARAARQQVQHHLSPDYQSTSYESDNDEWLRKRDLATRKTQDPKSWLTRTTSGIQSKLSFVTVETPKIINGVAAARKLRSRNPKLRGGRRRNPIPPSKNWKLSYKERTKGHTGYFDVDFFSLFDSSAVGPLQPHHLDPAPWESRDVRQQFLHDHSIGFSRNWFGKAQRARGNDRIKERVAHPKSMEMPMENKPHPNEWTEEWYTTWKAPNSDSNNQSRSVTSSGLASSGSGTDHEYTEGSDTMGDETCSSYIEASSQSGSRLLDGSSSYSSAGHESASEFTDGEYEYEDTPQCGTLINVRPKIGERVSRIHPEYTSQLRRSRWRKKYFPRGTFPYDKFK